VSRAEQFAPLDAAAAARWSRFGLGERMYFPGLVGLVVEEVRVDYCRMRLPFKPELQQAGGVVHGGAIASLLDSAVVPAVGSTLDPAMRYSTVDMHVQFIGALVDTDAVAEGWVTRRGRTTVFCESEAREHGTGRLLARSILTYHVAPPRAG
jgi:uncharacterized protein (TIGR00369 family)